MKYKIINSKHSFQISNFKFKIGVAFLTAFAASNALLTPASANTVSLSTYPSTIQLRSNYPNDARGGFVIENKSDKTIKLKIALKPFKADATNDGKVVYIEGNDPAILKKVQILEKDEAVSSIELGPKQSKQLSMQIAIDEKEPESDYYFSIIFLSDEASMPEESSTDVTAHSAIQAGIALNVLLHVGPKETPNGTLETFSTDTFRTGGPVPFEVVVKNNGKHYFTPKGVILIKNFFGQTVGRVDLQNANILVGTSRSLTGIPYQDSAKKNSQNFENLPTHSPTWPEKFLLGYYTAELSIALSEEGPVLTHATRFLAIPINYLLIFFLILALGIFLTLRIRRKMREV